MYSSFPANDGSLGKFFNRVVLGCVVGGGIFAAASIAGYNHFFGSEINHSLDDKTKSMVSAGAISETQVCNELMKFNSELSQYFSKKSGGKAQEVSFSIEKCLQVVSEKPVVPAP